MPTNPVLSARRRAGPDWRAVAADATIMIIGWSLLCLILHSPEAMLVLVALPLGWHAFSSVSSAAQPISRQCTAHDTSPSRDGSRRPNSR